MKRFKFILIIIIITACGYMLYDISQNNTPSKKLDTQVQSSQTKTTNNKIADSATNDNFSVLVQSSLYNAVVSLDETSKEVNIKLLDEVSDSAKDSARHYINLSSNDLEYLAKNADSLLNQFKTGDLMEKYTLITDMLKSYDTNIDQGDLIGIGLNFLK